MKTLHCEVRTRTSHPFSLVLTNQQEAYRGQGFAKAVALKLFQEKSADFASDGLYHADVAFDNLQSQGVCKSLGGTVKWSVYCRSISGAVLSRPD